MGVGGVGIVTVGGVEPFTLVHFLLLRAWARVFLCLQALVCLTVFRFDWVGFVTFFREFPVFLIHLLLVRARAAVGDLDLE